MPLTAVFLVLFDFEESYILDTDGLWADEWDVDMGLYEGHQGDRDARDARDMRHADQFRKHGDVDEKVGDFEKHTKVLYILASSRTILLLQNFLIQ